MKEVEVGSCGNFPRVSSNKWSYVVNSRSDLVPGEGSYIASSTTDFVFLVS